MAVTAAEPRPAVFLDKDGTLVANVPYNVEPDRMELLPGAGRALRRLQDAGYALVVVTNQSGVARGYFPPTALRAVRWRLESLLDPFGVRLDDFRACVHHPKGVVAPYARECDCRKPKPGLLLGAAVANGIDLSRSWMVGDILDDVEAGCRAGCRTVLLDGPGVGGETEWLPGECRDPDCTAGDLEAAAEAILATPVRPKEARCNATYSN
ncbi:MAG TPA: HAD family hydrolase [Trueperaceae bacterium]